ncbi:hypothetical protein [Pandoraea pulmonicola]|uniref:Uncharacterized protein n=2 Tax=Pandoraea pulmonicola TaxID=93221 RepID=A0ABN4ET06_PANPU|nr:hypothetical protein [Pandoraea pulmonicola]AJC22581.1 hypothetical protein RO07_22715 [Pandoraea pulmonicola]
MAEQSPHSHSDAEMPPDDEEAFMKIIFQVLLTLSLFGQVSVYAADSPTFKSMRNVDRNIFGKYVEGRMSEAFDGRLATIYPCGDRPAYYCQGLMVTAFEANSTYWMDPKTKRLSYTYFRKDIATPLYGSAGLALWPQASVDHDFPKNGPNQQAFTPVYRCAFPNDGNTDSRSDNGCGEIANEVDSAPCASLGITTAQQWLDKYGNLVDWDFCGFTLNHADGSDKTGMDVVIQIDATLKRLGKFISFPWNEIVAEPWPSNEAGRIPLMAFFSLPDPGSTKTHSASLSHRASLATAQAQQKKYYDLTNIFVPIIEISSASATAIFVYRDEDQAPGIPDLVTVFPQ